MVASTKALVDHLKKPQQVKLTGAFLCLMSRFYISVELSAN
ncbi:hypothetical protein Mar181_2735 [Marinomonas posidonica IVIA-Po-181]|uniref:Uncharacterized protein n=1 Tax=Marinomonas posidonica (strain CECT 7376 / NCIMB 14433 / IVIA-Po-181) TaxID=491952 RepID=F6CYT4_MARPP|nr:hypothetical protein Mar181_2735 [Marinomonas posidonica IVIA-Po-181]